jgi:large subunit ribosomal protein L19e
MYIFLSMHPDKLLLCHCSGQNVRKLVKDGFVIRKPAIIHSRSRARIAAEARSKGRHTGYGKPLTLFDPASPHGIH